MPELPSEFLPEFLSVKLANHAPIDNVSEILTDTAVESRTDKKPEHGEGNGTGPLRDLRRLRQLVQEIRTALDGGNMSVVTQAATLLAPALARWAASRPLVDPQERELLNLTQETQCAMAECEQIMQLAMDNLEVKRNHLRHHQRHLKQLRALRPAPYSGRTLDARQ